MPALSSLYRLLRPRANLVVGLCLAFVAASGLFASRLVVREDAATLVPESPQTLVDQFAVLRDAPFLRGLAVTVGGPDPAGAADLLAQALRGPEFSFVYSGGAGFSPETLADLCRFSPGLMSEEAFAALPERVTEEAVRVSLARDARLLLSPRGLALRNMLALDPLGICAGTLQRLAPANSGNTEPPGGQAPQTAAGQTAEGRGTEGQSVPGPKGGQREAAGPRLENGHLLSADGKYALVLAEPAAPVGDSLAAAVVMDRVRQAVGALPEGTSAVVAGGHRHTEENAGIIKGDLVRVLPVSLVLLAALYFVFIRSRQGAAIVLLPAASLAVAAALAGLVQGGLSGIALGFGSVVLGITADYAIHVYFSIRCGRDAGESVQRVSRPLLLGAATTLAAFAAFAVSGIPCIRQMALLAACGIFSALAFALVVLPHCVSPASVVPVLGSGRRGGGSSNPQASPMAGPFVGNALPGACPETPEHGANTTCGARGGIPLAPEGFCNGCLALASRARGRLKLAVLWALLAAALALLFSGMPVDGDIRKLSYVSEANARDEAFTRELWGGLRGGAFAAVRGVSPEDALRRNDGLYADLARLAAGSGAASGPGGVSGMDLRDVTSLAPLLPSAATQAERHAVWSAFWRDHAPETLERLARLAPGVGFAPAAFAPFADWIVSPPATVRAENLTAVGLALPHLLLRKTGDGAYAAYTLLPDGISVPGAAQAGQAGGAEPSVKEAAGTLWDVLERHGAVYASGGTFRAAVDAATRSDLLRFGGVALAAILAMTALVLRSPFRMGVALLPVGAGLLAVLGVFRMFGMSLNIFHTMALPLVMALSVDYGIFMLARLEGALGPESARGVLLSGLSTLAGFGALLLARHPALFSLGVSVSLGLAASLIAALALLPRLGMAFTPAGNGDAAPEKERQTTDGGPHD